MAGLALRPFAAGDADALRALWVASWNATLPEIDFAARQGWFRSWLTEHLATGAAVVCAVDEMGLLVGFAGIDPASGHMEQIAVHPNAGRRGIGTALLGAAKALSPRGITLRVNQENPGAVTFYRRAGFVITAEGVNTGGQRPIFEMAWRPGALPRFAGTRRRKT